MKGNQKRKNKVKIIIWKNRQKKRERKSYRIFPPEEISFLAQEDETQEDEKTTSDECDYE